MGNKLSIESGMMRCFVVQTVTKHPRPTEIFPENEQQRVGRTIHLLCRNAHCDEIDPATLQKTC